MDFVPQTGAKSGTSAQMRTQQDLGDSRWERWLKATVGEETVRGIARKAGVSHTTVRRWIADGVPHNAAWELTVRFRGDPALTCVVLGYVQPDEVGKFNYAAVVKYATTKVLVDELARRVDIGREQYPHIKMQDRVADL